MNPPPSYQEVLQLLNTTKKNEMKLIDEITELKKKLGTVQTQLENVELELKVKTDEGQMFLNAYSKSKMNEYKLKKIMSKL